MGKENLYPGINPHLNSHLQYAKSWKGYHLIHIGHIGETIEEVLPPGYRTFPEESLQVITYDHDVPLRKSQTYPDITIYSKGVTGIAAQPGSSVPTLILPVIEEIDEEDTLSSVMIFDGDTPVTRIELLSPANKPGGSHAEKYLGKREETLRCGITVVEIDYLHELPPIIDRIPSYPERQTGSFPYVIMVSDPRPELHEGITRVYGFGVLEKLPVIDIPLADKDVIQLDFGKAYRRTFESNRTLYETYTDYTREPVNFDAYSDADKALIRQHMAKIAGDKS